jgi:hypothetical protein
MTDDELLDGLALALAPSSAAPSAASVRALRRAVSGLAGEPSPRPRRRVGHRVAIPAAVLVTVLGSSSAVAAASGASLPRPLRAAAFEIGLPVDSPALVDARATESELRRELAAPDHQKLAAEVAVLRSRLTRVEESERRRADHEAESLLQEADKVLEEDRGGTGQNVRDQSPAGRPVTGKGAGQTGKDGGHQGAGHGQGGRPGESGASGASVPTGTESGGEPAGRQDTQPTETHSGGLRDGTNPSSGGHDPPSGGQGPSPGKGLEGGGSR